MSRLLIILCILGTSMGSNAQNDPMFLGGHVNDVTSVAYSPDGQYIVTGCWDGHVFVYYNDSTPTYYLSFADHRSAVNTLAFSRDSRYLLTAGMDGEINKYYFPHPDSMDFIRLDTVYAFGTKPVNKVFYGPGLRMIFSGDDAGKFAAYDIKKKMNRDVNANAPIKAFAVSIDRMHYFIATKGSSDIVQYDILGKEIRRFSGHQGEINDLEVTVDRKYLISGSTDKTVKIWNLQTGKMAISLSNHTWDVTALSVDPYSRYVASCGLDGTVNIYAIANGQLLRTFKNTNGRCNDIAFSPDLKSVIVGLHMDSPGEEGYGSNIWSTGLERPKAAAAEAGQSKAMQEAIKRATERRKKAAASKKKKEAAKEKSSSTTTIKETDQIKISIDN
ncbi:MAG: WD40 repeat domain-containing protein [Bacteroidia bacterium]